MQQRIRVRVGAVIVRNNAIVLVEYDDDKSGRHFNLPGGGVEDGESLHDALRREVLEETCMTVDVGQLLLVWEYVPSHHAEKYGLRHEMARASVQCTFVERGNEYDAGMGGLHWTTPAHLSSPRHRVYCSLLAQSECLCHQA